MTSWADRCESVWLDAGLGAVLVTGLTALAMIQCRQPARRRIWGRLGSVASLAILPLAWFSPLPRIDLRHPTSALWMTEVRSEEHPPSANQVDASARGAEPHPTPPWSSRISRGFLIFYGCGLAVGVGRLGLGLVGSRLLVSRARRASARAEALLQALPFPSGRHRRPRLLISDRSRRPVLVGFFRPTILIPTQLDRPDVENRLRLGLLHELAHAEVADHQYAWIAAVMRAVWFFLPQVWWLQSQLRLDAEFLADRRAVEYFGTSRGYAESLVGLALETSAGDSPPDRSSRPAVTSERATPPARRAGGFASALFQRVQMLLKCPFKVENQAPRSWVVAVAVVMAGWTTAASCLSIRGGRDRSGEVARSPVAEAVRAFRLGELAIAPQLFDDRPFDLRFRLPDRFQLACEILAEPAELSGMEILGYRLTPSVSKNLPQPDSKRSAWRRVEIRRELGGFEAVHVDGTEIVAPRGPSKPASWLTIRPIPGRTTRLRDLNLVW